MAPISLHKTSLVSSTIATVAVVATLILGSVTAPAVIGKETKGNSTQVKAWQLEQQCHASGQLKTTYYEKAIRLDFPNPGFSLVAQAPDWTVYLFNDKRHRFVKYKLANFKGLRKDTLFAVWFRDRKWVKFGETQRWKDGNYRLETYRIDPSISAELGEQEKKAVMRVSPDLPWPENISRIFAFAVKVPRINKIPIDGTIPRTMMGAKTPKYFQTKSLTTVTVSKSFFEVPRQYSEAKSETEVTHDTGVDSLVDIL